MLQSTHGTHPKEPHDTNTYTLGEIGMHNIVIASLPSERYGTNNASLVANNMLRSFPSITVLLGVGIGGGIPKDVDIRLGDVVVSNRVIQYDFGKSLPGGRFKMTSCPREPPVELGTAVTALRAVSDLESRLIPTILSEICENNPELLQYTDPSLLRDELFEGTYDHMQQNSNCDDCDRHRLVNRSTRKDTYPRIHYGIIASGNRVIKDGTERDRLAHELNAICFDMEAAGLMDVKSCLVIRGISDYSDSHKNDEWHEYAALTAAAYAKALLSEMPVNGVKDALKVVVPKSGTC
ncbi:hypothetical protein TCE0_015f02904 [Talaromyces pinophilus]|uniref:Nucleoside phosphorylase domain-containing protein n=1 Tax=Talaromyces pinophilus TaxID=128442 RepID=A0A6V8H0Z2_TALPI|nr:hypothetical protein TCE0_015f02904 [Talaromyces pinophilus]